MNGSIVIGMEAAGRTRQGIAPAQPCATRDSAQIKFTEHVGQGVFALSAICAGDGACVRAIGILGSLETETVAPQIQWPAPNSQSAHASRALMLGRHAYGLVADAGQQAYQHEKVLADARNSKLAGLAAAVAGPQREG